MSRPVSLLAPSKPMARSITFGPTPTILTSTPSVRSTSPTPTLTDVPPSHSSSDFIRNDSASTLSIDSIWNEDYSEGVAQRRREDDAVLAGISDNRPNLTIGFAVTPGQSMSRRTSRQNGERRSVYSSRSNNSRAVSRVDVGVEGNAEAGQVDFPRAAPSRGLWGAMERNRRKVRSIMRLKKFHLIMIGLVGFDLVVVMAELILALLTASCPTEELYLWLENALELTHSDIKPSNFACSFAPSPGREALETTIFSVNLTLLCTFTIEVFSAIYAFGPKTYCSSWVSVLDGSVVLITLCLDTYFHLSKDPAAKSPIALVILRLWKIFRAVHAIAHALELHYEEVVEAAEIGKEKLEWERIAESVRLRYVRAALVKSSGEDVDPQLVEEEVKKEIALLKAKRAEEEEVAEMQEAPEPEYLSKGRQWVDRILRRGGTAPSNPPSLKAKKSTTTLGKPEQ